MLCNMPSSPLRLFARFLASLPPRYRNQRVQISQSRTLFNYRAAFLATRLTSQSYSFPRWQRWVLAFSLLMWLYAIPQTKSWSRWRRSIQLSYMCEEAGREGCASARRALVSSMVSLGRYCAAVNVLSVTDPDHFSLDQGDKALDSLIHLITLLSYWRFLCEKVRELEVVGSESEREERIIKEVKRMASDVARLNPGSFGLSGTEWFERRSKHNAGSPGSFGTSQGKGWRQLG
ncbi:hypothetical protein DL96DRAFT_1623959 [Flagelloscypha sp. PMI_526]|nr:hypothetical protein DL96DRAFT_1623959 [Flagelloscypha sp. PMI_526]